MKILVSACLLGVRVRYDGQAKETAWIRELSKQHEVLTMCPEVQGGLPVPREPAEIHGTSLLILDGHVSDKTGVYTPKGQDVTEAFLKGAEDTLVFCKRHGINLAILKERSPSCGKSQVYDGSHTGVVIGGMGITAALLKRNGIQVFSEEDEAELSHLFKVQEKHRLNSI